MLLPNGDKLAVDIRNITKEQADQMFDVDHIRTLPEQKAWMVQQEKKLIESSHDDESSYERMPYRILSGKVLFSRDVELSKQEIRRILQEM